MSDNHRGDVMLAHKSGHRVDALACQGSEDTERSSEDAKLVAQRDANPLLAVVNAQHPSGRRVISPSPACGRGGWEVRGVRHFGA